jgi:4-amino-4-deoxy-L-arabinose transferase-like glycosyltransferase
VINKKIHIIILLLFITGVFFSRLTGKPILQPDSYTYMATANSMLEGNWYLEMWGRVPVGVPSFYPLLIAWGTSWFGIENHVAAFLISVLSSTFLIILVFLWAARRLGWGWAWVAALLVAFNTSLMFYGITLLTESIFTLLFFAAAGLSWVILRQRGHPPLYLFVGILMGLAIITKSSAWILPAILLCWIGFYVLSGVITVQRALTMGILVILGVLLITQPVGWKTHIPGGGGEFSGKKSLVSWLSKPDLRNGALERERYFAVLNPAGEEFQVEVSQRDTLNNFLISRGTDILRIIAVNLGLAIKGLFILIPWWLLIWIPGGIWIQWKRGDKVSLAFSVYLISLSTGFVGFYSLAGAYTSALGPERYTVPLIPLLILLVTAGLRATYEEAGRVWNVQGIPFRTAGTGIVFLLIALVFFSAFSQGKRILFAPHEKRWIKSGSQVIGESIKRGIGSGQRIMVRDPSIPYYADGLWVMTPFEPLDRVIGFARKKMVRLIIVRKGTEGRNRPHLIPLLRKEFTHPGLRRIIGVPGKQSDDFMELAIYELQ